MLWGALLGVHKTTWRGAERLLVFGPRAQAVLMAYLDRPSEQHLFRPVDVYTEWCAANGRRPNLDRRSRIPGEWYQTSILDATVRRGCRRAGVRGWTPNQLRHLVATEIETRYDRESAQAVLGHDNPTTTSVYSERAQKAAKILAEMG